MSICLSPWNNPAPPGWIFMKFDIWLYCKKIVRKFKIHYNWTRIAGTLREDQYTFVIIYCSFLLRMRNISDKTCTEDQHTHFMFTNFLKKMCSLWANVEKYNTPRGNRWQHGARAFHAGYPRIQTHTFGICNTYCFSNTIMVVQMPLNIMFYVHCPSCLTYWEMFFCKDTHKVSQKNCAVAAFLLPDK
jgi:hypothetical protein